MKNYKTSDIRNVAVVGHSGDGKTTLVEALLYATGAISRQGTREAGTTVCDYDPLEKKRQKSISAAVAPIEYNSTKINLIDVPGAFDFAGEMVGPLSICEGALITVSAVSGLDVGAEKAWDLCEKTNTARMIVINQMDQDNANFQKALASVKEKYGTVIAPIEVPIYEKGKFVGVVGVLKNKAFIGEGKNRKEIPIPANMADDVQAAREAIMEAAAGADEELMEKYFEEMELSNEDTIAGIRKGAKEGTVVPVVCCSAVTRIGIGKLLDFLVELMPSPADNAGLEGVNKAGEAVIRDRNADESFSGRVFKTIADPFVGKLSLIKVVSGTLTPETRLYNSSVNQYEKMGNIYFLRGKEQIQTDKVTAGDICAIAKLQYTSTTHTVCSGMFIKYPGFDFPAPCIAMAVYAKKAGDEDKIFSGLSRLAEEDPTITVTKNVETTESLLSGLGEQHLQVIAEKLKSKFGADCTLQQPKIAYRESIRKAIDVQGRHKKQSGGHGQFGDVKIKFRPNDDGSTDFIFEDAVVGGAVPRNFIPAVEKGLRDNIKHGVLAGFPVVGLTAQLYDGSYHPVDSSEMAFKTAARIAFKQLDKASPVLLEPVHRVEVLVPDENMGDIMGDMNKRRGRIMGMDKVGDLQCITAEVPEGEMYKYATDLLAMTEGRGSFSMKFERYEEVPAADAKKIIESAKKDDEDDE